MQVALARKWGQTYGVDPRLLLAIGGHETQWGTTGAGRPSQGGYALGYGVTDSGILSKYHGLANQYMYGAKTLAGWGVHNLADVMAGKASQWATDPAWEKGVQSVYKTLPGNYGKVPTAAAPTATAPTPTTTRTAAAPPTTKFLTQQVFDPLAFSQGILALHPGEIMSPDLAAQSMKTIRVPVTVPGRIVSPTGQVQTVPVTKTAPANPNVPATGLTSHIVRFAARQLGQPYVWGGESRKEGGFDCSGLVDWSLRQVGYKGPRLTTWSIAKMGVSVKNQQLRPGDLVLCNNNDHVVIYAGNGKVIAAPHTGTVVQWQPLSRFKIDDVRRV